MDALASICGCRGCWRPRHAPSSIHHDGFPLRSFSTPTDYCQYTRRLDLPKMRFSGLSMLVGLGQQSLAVLADQRNHLSLLSPMENQAANGTQSTHSEWTFDYSSSTFTLRQMEMTWWEIVNSRSDSTSTWKQLEGTAIRLSPTLIPSTQVHNVTSFPISSSDGIIRKTTITASTRTVSHRVTRTVKPVTLSTGDKAVVEPAVVATLTTQTLPPQTVTETHTHSAIYLTTVTTSLLCTYERSECYVLNLLIRRNRNRAYGLT